MATSKFVASYTRLVIMVVSVGLAFSGCGGGDSSKTSTDTTSSSQATTSVSHSSILSSGSSNSSAFTSSSSGEIVTSASASFASKSSTSTPVSSSSINSSSSSSSSSVPATDVIDMSGRTATSQIINSRCSHVPGGFEYVFSDSAIKLIGSDTWDSSRDLPCRLADINEVSVSPTQISDGDFAFHCQHYPNCFVSEFERSISGVDIDGREFTAKSSYDPATLQITYVKEVTSEDDEKTTFTEVVTIEGKNRVAINMTGRVVNSVMSNSACPGAVGGFTYTFSNDKITMIGADNWNGNCELVEGETVTVTPEQIAEVFHGDFGFNCRNYPICEVEELKRKVSGIDVDNRVFESFSRFDQAKLILVYSKVVAPNDGKSDVSFIETFNLKD